MREKINWDVFGMGTSFLCAIHCSVLPFFLFLGFMKHEHSSHVSAFDVLFFALAVFFGFFAFRKEILARHFSLPLILMMLGISLLCLSLFLPHGSSHVVSVLGGITMLIAHFKNYQVAHS